VQVWTPAELTAEQERLFRDLQKVEGQPPAEDKVGRGFWNKIREAFGA
jgi:hypothetical protein